MSFCFCPNPLSRPSPTQEGRKSPTQARIKKETNIMTTSYSPTRKWKHKNKKISRFPVFPVVASNNNSPNTHSRHLTVMLEASSPDHNTASPYHPHQDNTMPPRSMPIEHPVTYQAFREITNFIRNNGDDWDEFCTSTNTTQADKKANTTKTKMPKKRTKQKFPK